VVLSKACHLKGLGEPPYFALIAAPIQGIKAYFPVCLPIQSPIKKFHRNPW